MKVLVVVDMQKDFVDGALGTAEARAIVPAVKAKIDEYRANDGAIFFTRDTHDENYLETQEGKNLPVKHCIRGTEGHQFIEEVLNSMDLETDEIIDKPSFGSLELMDILIDTDECDEEIESIELCGVCTGICVLSNAAILKAALNEAEIIVDANACACVTPASHQIALAALKLLQVTVLEG